MVVEVVMVVVVMLVVVVFWFFFFFYWIFLLGCWSVSRLVCFVCLLDFWCLCFAIVGCYYLLF